MRTAAALTPLPSRSPLPPSPAPSPGHDGPTGQAGEPPREGWRHRNAARGSWVSKGGTR